MNNQQMKSQMRRMLGNLQDSHPMIAAGDDQMWINHGVADIVMEGLQGLEHGMDKFPELRCSWVSDLTIAAINSQRLPNDKLLITAIHSFDLATIPDANTTSTKPMGYMRPEKFDQIVKDSSRVGYPSVWTMRGADFFYHPTPSAAYLTYMRLWGVQRDPWPEMSAPGDTPMISSIWHEACVLKGAARGARALGWFDKAAEFDSEAARLLGTSLNIGATEDAAHTHTLGVEGMVDRGTLYGGGM